MFILGFGRFYRNGEMVCLRKMMIFSWKRNRGLK